MNRNRERSKFVFDYCTDVLDQEGVRVFRLSVYVTVGEDVILGYGIGDLRFQAARNASF